MKILIILILLIPILGKTQPNKLINFSAGNEKVAIFDFKESLNSLNPYIEFSYKIQAKTNLEIYHNFKTFFLKHKYLQTSVGVGYYIEPRFNFSNFFIGNQTGLSYMLNYSYLNNYSNKSFSKSSNFENKLALNLDILIGYKFSKFELFVKFSNLFEFPFLKYNSPILPHQILSTGINFQL
ncbi:MAG: hypothetical protein SNJ71_08925 [Bacteroidales bacterium]